MTEETAGAQPSLRPALKVVDATLRDGGLVNDFRFSDDFVRALYAADLAAGVIRNATTGAAFAVEPFPPFIRRIIERGGLVEAVAHGDFA